jgi:flagellar basal-body rod modification protein FlgD
MIDPVAATTTTRTPPPAPKPERPTDYETFLRMLTVQMQNQDPLNPIESDDYAVQLATFSGVEQQTRTNALLEQLLAGMNLAGLSDLAAAVGQEALSTAPVAFDGATPVALRPDPVAGADRAVLVVRDAQGQVVAREDMAAGATAHTWTGRGITGAPLPAGRYSFSAEAQAADQVIAANPVPAYARIEEVRSTASGVALVLQGGVLLPADALLALRA